MRPCPLQCYLWLITLPTNFEFYWTCDKKKYWLNFNQWECEIDESWPITVMENSISLEVTRDRIWMEPHNHDRYQALWLRGIIFATITIQIIFWTFLVYVHTVALNKSRLNFRAEFVNAMVSYQFSWFWNIKSEILVCIFFHEMHILA